MTHWWSLTVCRYKDLEFAVNLPLTVLWPCFQGWMCVICLVDYHVNVVISSHILWLFPQKLHHCQRLMVKGWFHGQDACQGPGHSTLREVRAPRLPAFSPSTLLLLLRRKAHLLHFPRRVEVERAQTPCSTKNTHTHCSHNKGSNSSWPHGTLHRTRNLHSAFIASTTYHNTFQLHKWIWTSTPQQNTHTHKFAHTCFILEF